MKLVVGSTGMLGGMIARKLLARGDEVRVMVRPSSDYKALLSAGAEVVFGDLKDAPSVEAACQGVTAVVTTANAVQRGGEDTIDSVDIAGNRNLIDAAKKAGVKQFVFLSTSQVDEASPVPIFAAKAKTEAYLRASGVGWTILAPHAFMDVWFAIILGGALGSGKPIPLVAGGTKRHSFVAVDDVAELAVAAIGNPRALNQRILLGGPQAMSWSELVAETGRIVGRDLSVDNIVPGQPIPTLPPPLNHFIGFVLAGHEQQDVIIDSSATARAFGITPTPASQVLMRMFGAS